MLCPFEKRWKCRGYHWILSSLILLSFLYFYVVRNSSRASNEETLYAEPQIGNVADRVVSSTGKNSSSRSHNSAKATLVTAASSVLHHPPTTDTDRVTNNYATIIKIRQWAGQLNENETVLNADKFPPLALDGLVMIVQVHRRTEYLRMLIESLRVARDISKVLLVVSFDYYDNEILAVVDNIDFCKVIKIFFPKSIQLYPGEFPAESPNDCPRDISREKAKDQGCANAEHPDSYGHYREAGVTAIKHHWWWKINHVFDGMKVTAGYHGYVVFLEEDLYVAPDIVVVTKQLISMKDKHCPDCDLIGLGVNQRSTNLQASSNKANVLPWRNNLAYAINRLSWNNIRKCSKEFCTFDDYNWDWTLYSLQSNCYHRSMKAVILKAPRIYHIGNCGTHQRNHDNNCNGKEAASDVRNYISANQQYYFPTEMLIDKAVDVPGARSRVQGFGGWGDPRDHELCLSFVHDT